MLLKVRIIQPRRQDYSDDADEMGRRRRQARRIGRSRLDRFAIGALMLAAGLLAASLYINVEMYETRGVGALEPELASKDDAQERQQKIADEAEARESDRVRQDVNLPRNAPLERSIASRDSVVSPNDAEQANNPKTQPPVDGPPADAADRQPEATDSPNRSVVANQPPAEADADIRAQAQDPGDREPDMSAADMAQLETVQNTPDEFVAPNIPRAQLTTGIDDREPVDRVGAVFPMSGEPLRTLYYFTEIVDMGGETVTHRWEHEGVVIAEISFEIGSDYWRTWSSKDLTQAMAGDWRVVVTDTDGNVIRTDSFVYAGP